jgi:mono/diheme cytochrome c family protein
MTPAGHAKRVVNYILFLFLLTLSACGTTPPTGNAEDGQKWYKMNNCNACHGENGNGGRGPNIAGIDMGFGSFVKKLRKKDAPIMPPYPESKISEQDAADIYTYLKSVK